MPCRYLDLFYKYRLFLFAIIQGQLSGVGVFGLGTMVVILVWLGTNQISFFKILKKTNVHIDDRGVAIQKEGETAAFIPWSECKIRAVRGSSPRGLIAFRQMYFMNKRFKDTSYYYGYATKYSNDLFVVEYTDRLRDAVSQYLDPAKIVGLTTLRDKKVDAQKDWKPDEE